MTILRDISAIWALLHTLVLFYILFESRFSKKKTNTIILVTMIPLIIINFIGFLYFGPAAFGTILLITCTLPSLVVFWYLAKNRGGRFLFTFCMVDSLVLDLLYITQIIDHYVSGGTYIFIFVSRILIFPLLEIYFYKKVRNMYFEIQNSTKKGWYVFAAISAIFYVLISLMMNRPVSVLERPEYIPQVILVLILIPVIYLHILGTLIHQNKLHEIEEQDNILKLQVANMKSRMDEYSSTEEKFRIERHDIRHKLQAIESLAKSGEYEKLLDYINECDKSISETKVKHYCSNTVLDAVLSSYIHKAENKVIKVSTSIELPDYLPVNESELATVFANAIENAINACSRLPEQKRFINIKTLVSPQFMVQISNSFDGEIILNEEGIPQNIKKDHGFGIRSIIAFCEKNNVYYEFKTDAEEFIFRIIF